ncbi:hypothetical protein GHT06_013765 [Daphnia sinensis]|uniref:PPM-type phosphatase domain-containing protein n=1 Tax=Daphnia sinensis TaxID=1820382 RepID=A0AAD5KSG7_9CRUS|nr:hypothetical protein GHT06_013765 [Daphnia sinensis]
MSVELFTSSLSHLFHYRPFLVTRIVSAMLNKFKNAFFSVVNNLDATSPDKNNDIGPNGEPKLPLKFPYSRPHFLQLNGEDEIQVAGDHAIRPIIVPRDITKIPWNSGYAEAVNAGKSLRNEDQARIHVGYLERRHSDNGHSAETTEFHTPPSTPEKDSKTQRPRQRIPYVYFALFDGHAGTGAAISAANELHCILHDKLMDVIHHLLPPTDTGECAQNGRNQVLWFPEREISVESFIVGALEATFHEMDNLIAEDRFVYRVTGGCTVVVSLFICGKLFVSNAGDSRAVLCRGRKAFPLSNDFTPETERQRIRKLAALQPELLGGEYTALDFSRRPNRRDIGQRLLYREPHMTGWAYKTVTPEDLKFPVVYGEGKRSRVLATIGVTRGFGDHDLRAPNSNILIKPFLSSQPEVRIVDIEKEAIYETDVLVMGTDGLWDVTSNERVAETVQRSLEQFPIEDSARYRYRFTSAAQDLVMCSRGKLNERSWRTADSKSATIDDISVFVIPLAAYKEEYLRWKLEMESQTVRPETKEADIPVSEPAASLPTVSVASQPARMTEQPANVNGTPAENETALSDPSVDAVNVEKDEGIVVMEEEAVGPPPSEGAVDPLQLPADPEKNESNS